MFLHDYELGKAADVLTRELFKLKPGETFVITADTDSKRLVDLLPHFASPQLHTLSAYSYVGLETTAGVDLPKGS